MAGQEVDRSKNDFSKGPVWKCIVMQAVPLTIAQLVQLLYNVIDRIYIGHMGDGSSIALTRRGANLSYCNTYYGIYRTIRNRRRTTVFNGTRRRKKGAGRKNPWQFFRIAYHKRCYFNCG